MLTYLPTYLFTYLLKQIKEINTVSTYCLLLAAEVQ